MAEVINSTRRPLPYGFFTRRHYNIYLLIVLGTIVLDVFFSILLYKGGHLKHFLLFAIFQVALLGTVVVIAYLVQNPIIKILKRLFDTCTFTRFNRSISDILKQRLHPETIKFLILIWVRYMYLYDAAEADYIFTQMLPPKGMFNKYLYRYNMAQHYIFEERYHEASEIIRKEIENSRKVNLNWVKLQIDLEMFDRRYAIKGFNYEIPQKEKIYILNIRNSYLKMHRHVLDGDLREAKVIAKYVEDHAGDLNEVIYAATKILKMRSLVAKEKMFDTGNNGVVKTESSDIDLNQLLQEIEQETAMSKQKEAEIEATKTMPKSIEEAIKQEEMNNQSSEEEQ